MDAETDGAGRMWLADLARLQRLRAGLSLNYAALGLMVDLLDRIAQLGAQVRTRTHPSGGRRWT